MQDPRTIAVYHLAYDADGTIVDERTGQPFDRETYSRMKYGDKAAAHFFAKRVAGELMRHVPELIDGETPPEFLAAYKTVPPACFYLSRYCLDIINRQRLTVGHEPGQVVRVYKNRVTGTDYAASSPEARQKELDGIGFSLEGRDIQDKLLVVLDDIKITGAAERTIVDVVQAGNASTLNLGYIAVFNQEQAAVSPSVERDLNLSVIKSVLDLLPAIADNNFDLNIRTLKMILGSEVTLLNSFLSQLSDDLLESIVRGGVDTGTDFVRSYGQGFDTVMAAFESRAH